MNSFVTFSAAILLLISASSAQYDLSANPNNAGGLHLDGSYTKDFVTSGTHNVAGTVFGSGNLNPGNSIKLTDRNYGVGVGYNNNGHGLSYHHSQNKHSSNDAVRGTWNLYDNGRSKVNVNAWGDRTRFRQKRQFNHVDQYGTNVEWQHINGHSASLGTNSIPKYDKQTIDAKANINLWKDKKSSLDTYAGASHDIGRLNKGHTDWNTGIVFKRRF